MSIKVKKKITLDGFTERRTRQVIIDCPKGQPYKITAIRELFELDEMGNALSASTPLPTIEKVLTADFLAADPEAANIANKVAKKIDDWDTGA